MAGINELSNISQQVKSYEKSEALKKTAGKKASSKVVPKETNDSSKDKTQISRAARELLALKQEAQKYIDQVKSAETISADQVKELKERIASRHYLDEKVIDKIIDRLINLPDFL